MRRRGQTTSLQERVVIGEKAEAGYSDSEIAQMIGCSIYTVRKWRRRYQKQGRAGLTSQMGRPATGALGSLPASLRQTICQLREAHPGWGPDTLLIALESDPTWHDHPLPSRSRIAAFLKQEGLTRRYRKHTELPQPNRQRPESPHQEWQMDAQGAVAVDGLGRTSTINIIDIASRLKIESCPCVGTRKPGTADYFLALRRAFLNYGLPQRLSLDHDTVFFDNTSPSPFPTRIHLWLLALGVDVIFTRVSRPTDHAIIERHHQTMEAQALTEPSWSSPEGLWQGLDERREVLNRHFPTRALGGCAPLEAYPEAACSVRPYRPEWEADLLSLERVCSFLAQGRWFRRIGDNGHFKIGGHLYYIGNQFVRREVELTFDPEQVAFICRPEGHNEPIRILARGLAKADLLGDLAYLQQLPPYQLALPITPQAWRRAELARLMDDTI